MKTTPALASCLAIVALITLASVVQPHVRAATLTWINTDVSATWSTSIANWNNGTDNVAWSDGNVAVFTANGEYRTVYLATHTQAASLSLTGGSGTIALRNNSLDVATIDVGSGSNFDMFATITGDHSFTFTGAGRISWKTAATYTGSTNITGGGMVLSDATNNILPTATTLNLIGTNSTFRLAANKSQQIAGLTGNGTVLSQGSGTNANTLTIHTVSGPASVFSGRLRANAATDILNLVISGTGIQELTGANNHSGATTLSGGTLKLGSSLTHTSSVTIDGGTLETSVANVTLGTGAVSMSSGAITPGGIGAAATLTLAADQDFIVTGGILNFDLGAASDQIIGSGAGLFSLVGATLALSLGDGFDYSLTYGILQGFAGGDVSGLAITGYDTANWTASLGESGFLSFTAVPEPATWAFLLSIATLAIAVIRRRK